ncbi:MULTISPECIES: sulfatase [unclassified Streptomyces]|uniref:sulfatase family protein n=1 Tax=unclassified Streptomyces TaxID=2593676 RepID=UPI000DC53F9C|nr:MULTISPECIES: sulfatase [unclassified Streptomyces]RAJ89231.1 arylsulfatase A-like enzyme [Streptomyces sp. PsTaAH-137]
MTIAGVRRNVPLWLGLAALAAGLVACDGAQGSSPSSSSSSSSPRHPNIVWVLTDDLSSDLVNYMPHVKAMQKEGLSFSNYTVTDSLCCPSRSSIFTGKFPHNTGVFTNMPPDGGFQTFHDKGNESKTFATALQGQGYRTAMMGKYLNGYEPDMTVSDEKNYVPPGWDEWDVAGNGYKEYDYTLNQNGRTVAYQHDPEDYLTDVVSGKGQDFIEKSVRDDKPFALDISTFAPHGPATPAPQDRDRFKDLKLPRPPAFDKTPADAPQWLRDKKSFTPRQIKKITQTYRKRVRAVQAVDRMIGDLQEKLKKEGVYDDTVFAFASDNGFHMGQYRLMPGKQTAFDTDVNVPLVVTGPGVRRGATTDAVASNIDICPTFTDLGGGEPDPKADGRSLVPLLKGGTPKDWPKTALVEHHGPDTSAKDPDKPRKGSGNPPSYEALRTDRSTYVEYRNGSHEYYDRAKDPDMLHNVYGRLSSETRARLTSTLKKMRACEGSEECGAAAGTG